MAEKMLVTPWEVKGDIDYDKLIKQFGTEKIDNKLLNRIKKHTGDLHFMLKRNIFFSHRDMKWILDQYEKGNRFALYTGRGPSGHTTVGHLLPWTLTKWLQDKFKCDLYFQFTDDEKFLFKKDLTLEQSNNYAHENMLDLIALGFDPKKTHFIVDTEHANLLYPIAVKVAKHLTFSTAKAVFGFKNDNNVGQIFYTAMQSAPAILPSVLKGKKVPVLIPLAIDQDPHFRVTRDIAPKMGYPKPAILHSMFLPGLHPGGKMSASDPMSTIYTTDTPKEIKKKIGRAFSGGRETIEEHRKKGGNPDIDVPFQYLRMMFEPDDKKLKKIYDDYKSGKMLSGEMKQLCTEKITKYLAKHQKKREAAKKKVDKFILKV